MIHNGHGGIPLLLVHLSCVEWKQKKSTALRVTEFAATSQQFSGERAGVQFEWRATFMQDKWTVTENGESLVAWAPDFKICDWRAGSPCMHCITCLFLCPST